MRLKQLMKAFAQRCGKRQDDEAMAVAAGDGTGHAGLPVARDYATMMSRRRMQVFEKARADDFLYWYYGHVE